MMTMSATPFLHLLCSCCLLLLHFAAKCHCHGGGRGQWAVLINSSGVSAMHMQQLNNDRVVILDRTGFGPSKLNLPPGDQCINQDCTAHSIEYDVASNTVRPLTVRTNTWCSSGALSPDGTLINTGGFDDGFQVVRVFKVCPECDWVEQPGGLAANRWYATSLALPDSRQIVVGGINMFNYEFVPKTAAASPNDLYYFGFLNETLDGESKGLNGGEENNLYPFVFLNVDGNLFVFANNRAVLLDHIHNVVLRRYPVIPGGDPRNYPCTGSAALLPLRRKNLNQTRPPVSDWDLFDPEVLVCGGAPRGAFTQSQRDVFQGALATCARMKINDPSPQWAMETMPLPRVMGDMLLLPTGDVLMINGAKSGSAGWESGRDPVLNPVLYSPGKDSGSRFRVLNPTQTPRMYHSSAVVLRDGRVLVGGSNPHEFDTFGPSSLFPTDMSLEAFSPPYMDPQSDLHPTILSPDPRTELQYGQQLGVRFSVPCGKIVGENVTVTLLAPSFTTHSFAMNQRLLVIGEGAAAAQGGTVGFEVQVTAPDSRNLAPPGYYILFVVHSGIASEGVWVHLS